MKRIFTIVVGIFFISALQVNAAYLKNISKTITQPDGTVIECFVSGDEFHNWIHDKNNYTIIQGQDGYYYYAKKIGEKIVPSKYKVGTTLLKSTDIEPGVNISADQWKKRRQEKLSGTQLKSHHLKNGGPEVNINQICIYVRFADDPEWSKDTSVYYDWLNDESASAASMFNFYKEVSYGKVEVRSHFYPKSTTATVVSYQDTHNRGYFQPYNETTNDEGYDTNVSWTDYTNPNGSTKREWDLLERVIDYLNANYTIPANVNLDHDNDDIIDNLEFFIYGEAGEWSELLWPHNWSIQDGREIYINGERLEGYNFQIEDITDQQEVGVLAHEMGHALGYPDLYQYSDQSTYSPVGPWDIMDATARVPQGFCAYTKYRYGGWIDEIPEITTAGTYSLKSLDSTSNNCYKIASPYTTDEYFVLEYRKKAGRFETSVPGSGLLIYRINTTAGRGNSEGPPDEVYLYRPGGTLTADGNVYQANFSSTFARTEINNTTDPKPFLTDGSIGGLYISEVGASNGTSISFRVDFNPDALYPDFRVSDQDVFAWENVDFTDMSLGTPETWEWTFEGGTPSSHTGQNPPSIQYSTPGTYDVELTITKGAETMTETRENYITVTALPGANPPRSLSAEVTEANPNDVVLNWTEPESGVQEFTIKWDDGTNYDGIGTTEEPDNLDVLSRWKPSDLSPYDDMYITEISIYAYSSSGTPSVDDYTLKIYTGSDLGTLAVDQEIPAGTLNFNAWNTIELATPHQIDASIDLWFGANYNSGSEVMGYPFGVDNGPAIAEKGDIMYYVGDGSLYYLNDYNLNYNWNLSATVVNSLEEPKQKSARITKALTDNYKAMEGYNIYRDGTKVNTELVTGTTYTETGVANGAYEYTVTAVYTAGESIESNVAHINVPYSVGIPDVEIKDISISPNPVKDILYAYLEDLVNEDVTINIFDPAGKLAYDNQTTISSNRLELPVSNLANGTYTLVIYNKQKAFKGKFVVMN